MSPELMKLRPLPLEGAVITATQGVAPVSDQTDVRDHTAFKTCFTFCHLVYSLANSGVDN